MTKSQESALHVARVAKHHLEKLAYADDNAPLTPALKVETLQHAENMQRLYQWLFASIARGDTFTASGSVDTPSTGTQPRQ